MSNKSIKVAGFSEGNSGVRIEMDNLGLDIVSIKGGIQTKENLM